MSVERIIETNGLSVSVVLVTLSWDDFVSEGTVAQEMAAGSEFCCETALGTSSQLLLVPEGA